MLFKTKDKVIEYAELSASINFNSLKPTIKMVELQNLKPFIGSELYTSLNDAYTSATDETSLSEPLKKLLDMCRSVIGPMLVYNYTPKAEVKLSDAGAQRMETTTNKTAFQNQVNNFREQNLREGELATELLLQFLEDNKSDYPLWVDSNAFADYRSLFIRSGGEFDTLFTSSSPYRNYWAMRSKMLDVEQNNIRALLGDTLFNSLKTKDQDDAYTLKTTEKDLLFKVKKVIAYLTVSLSIPFLNVRISANGITVMNTSRGQDDALSKIGNANDRALNVIIEKSDAAAKSWMTNVLAFLNEPVNADSFEGWPIVPVPVVNEVHHDVTDDTTKNFFNDLSGSYGLV